MTTIAYDGKTMAADSQGSGDFIEQIEYQKIFENDRYVLGIAGDFGVTLKLKIWLLDSSESNKPVFSESEHMGALVYCKNRKELFFMDRNLVFIPCGIPSAIGSGGRYAMGAMLAGASAKEAVEISKKLDVNTGGKIQAINIEYK
jgi:hypothetical protein